MTRFALKLHPEAGTTGHGMLRMYTNGTYRQSGSNMKAEAQVHSLQDARFDHIPCAADKPAVNRADGGPLLARLKNKLDGAGQLMLEPA
ncbi:hypothetical protein D3C73_1560190 [compost metagenome]